jgi:WD40 repeat protein
MVHLGDGRMVNCYNSGSIAIWDVSLIQDQTKPIAYIKNAHDDFVYKLRRVDRERLVSCGNDQFANLVDLETAQITGSYYHPESVWCCYPVDRSCLCSAGLLGHLCFWDIRSGSIVQVLQLLSSETSFVTHLDSNHLIFGDKRQISQCDLRKL